MQTSAAGRGDVRLMKRRARWHPYRRRHGQGKIGNGIAHPVERRPDTFGIRSGIGIAAEPDMRRQPEYFRENALPACVRP